MPSIISYIDHTAAKQFTIAIPEIRKKFVAKFPWNPDHNTYGVAGNTFRAYRGFVNNPSDLYRQWASTQCNAFQPEFLRASVASQHSFEVWHCNLANSLQAHWHSHEDGEFLTVAQKYKLVDLFVKWLVGHSFSQAGISEGLVKFGHCALDRQTLTAINKHVSMALPFKNPSMGHITTEQSYQFCQSLIREFSEAAHGTPILFDYYAWNPGG